MAIIKTKEQKEIYNQAIKKVAKLVSTYDGIILNDIERQVIVTAILKQFKK